MWTNMKKYILKRLLLMIPTFFGVTVVVYLLMSLAPGSPMDAFLSVPGITEAELLRIKESLGLDKPVFVQYYHWLVNILQGNFGYSSHCRQASGNPNAWLCFPHTLIYYSYPSWNMGRGKVEKRRRLCTKCSCFLPYVSS